MKLRDTLIASLVLVFSLDIWAAVDENHAIGQLAEKIVELRTEVENLNTEVNVEKEALQGKLKSLQAQRAQVSAQLEQVQLQVDQNQERLETVKKELMAASGQSGDLTPHIQEQITRIKQYVSTTLPFQKTKRLEAIQKIEDDLNAETLPAQKAMARLWAFVEDELRLGRENGIHRQTLVIDGSEELVSVAKLGMIALFYQTRDGRFGFVRDNGEGAFDYIPLKDSEQKALTKNLFEGLKKQIRTGAYVLPHIL